MSDFGLSTEAELASEFRGSVADNPTWTAPEILSKKKYTIKVDVYSFGVILWEMLTRKFFFGEIRFMSELDAAVRAGKRPAIPQESAAPLRILVDTCWAQDPSKRPVFPDVRKVLAKVAADLGIVESEPGLAQSDLLKNLPAMLRQRRESTSRDRLALSRGSSGSLVPIAPAPQQAEAGLFEAPQVLVPAHDSGVTVMALVGPHLWTGNSRGDLLVFDLATRVLIHQVRWFCFLCDFLLTRFFFFFFQMQSVPNTDGSSREASVSGTRKAALTSLLSMGHSVWSGSSDGAVTVWSRNVKIIKQLKKHVDGVSFLGSEGSETVVSACVRGQLRRWNIVSFKYTSWELEAPVSCMAQLGVNYVIGSNNNLLLLCPDKSWTTAPPGHASTIHSIHVVGDRVWTASSDKTIRLWYLGSDARSLVPAKVLPGHSSRVFSLANDLRQELVFSGSWDTVVMIWSVVN